jgi:hypothetical protein
MFKHNNSNTCSTCDTYITQLEQTKTAQSACAQNLVDKNLGAMEADTSQEFQNDRQEADVNHRLCKLKVAKVP